MSLFSVLGALSCCFITVHWLAEWTIYGNGLPSFDLYFFFWDVLPLFWEKHFNIIQYMFLLLPGALVCYFVTSYISTNILEVQYYMIIRYVKAKKWIVHSLIEIVVICQWVILLFHVSFLVFAVVFADNNRYDISLFSGQDLETPFLLIMRQVFFVASLSAMQFMISIKKNVQSGSLFFLSLFGIAVLFDMVLHKSFRLFCSSAWEGNWVWPVATFIAILLIIVLKMNNIKQCFYKGGGLK